MLSKAILVDADNACRIKRIFVSFMECDALWRTVDIDAFHASVTLNCTLTSMVIGIAACLAVVAQYHETIVLIPVHFTHSGRRVVLYPRRITVGIVRVMLMTNLARCARVVAVFILIIVMK